MKSFSELSKSAVAYLNADKRRWIAAVVIAALAVLLSLSMCSRANAQTIPTGTLSVSPKTLTGAGNATVTWNIPTGQNCVASGLWTGAKAASGTQTVPVTASGSFALKCDGPTPTAVLGWTLATKNTDGSTLTDLASTKVYRSASASGPFSLLSTVNVPGNSYTTTALPVGANYFVATSVNSAGTESAQTPVINVTVPAPASATFSDAVTVTTVPNPPTNLAVTIATLAYELRSYSGGTYRFVQVGTVPLNKECGPMLNGQYSLFTGATITKPTKGGAIAARCATHSG